MTNVTVYIVKYRMPVKNIENFIKIYIDDPIITINMLIYIYKLEAYLYKFFNRRNAFDFLSILLHPVGIS